MDHAGLHLRRPRRRREKRRGRRCRVSVAEPMRLPRSQRVELGKDGPAERSSIASHQYAPQTRGTCGTTRLARAWRQTLRKWIMTALKREMIERVKADKRRRRSSASSIRSARPCFLVQSFTVSPTSTSIDGSGHGDHELIVAKTLAGRSRERWMSYLDRPNDFLIYSNDLHEIRILDRAIRFARAEIVCLVQDDDLIPRDTAWLERALQQLSNNPRLAILGGFMGFESFDPNPAKARRIWEETSSGSAPRQYLPHFIRRIARGARWLGVLVLRSRRPGICFDTSFVAAWRTLPGRLQLRPVQGPRSLWRRRRAVYSRTT